MGRFSKFLPSVKVGVFFGGLAIAKDEQVLKNNCPHIVVGTPGRILALIRSKKLPLKNLKHFVLDECDKMLEQLDMRREEQEAVRVVRCAGIQSGCHLCEICATMRCFGPASDRAKLPRHRHTQGYEPGGEAQQVRGTNFIYTRTKFPC